DVKQYMQITAENIEKEDIENITLEVKLAKSEILDTDDVFLLHYTGSYWMKIKPYKVESDGSYYIFFIQINHFSYFAVVQNKPVSTSITEPSNEPSLVEEPENITIVDIDPAPAVDPEPVLEPAVNETDTGIPDEKESNGFLIILIPIFLVILVVGGGLVYYYTLHNHESEDDAEEDDKEDTSFLQELDKIINNSSDTSKAAKVPDKSKDSNYVPFNERVAQQGNVDWYKLQEKSKREHRDIIEHK
ncbi:MAG: hypothetical protein KAI55_04400, partial [Candidatus Aenigmarchaeota archaeon]|nr:hypothetical protein [Candidatus Aenigmarchaeota archaeon]